MRTLNYVVDDEIYPESHVRRARSVSGDGFTEDERVSV